MYDIGAYFEADSVQDAVKLLKENPDARIIAGGSDVLIKMREGSLGGCDLVSIQMVDELRGVKMDEDGTLRILPVSSFSSITADPIIKEHFTVLGEAVDTVGGPQIRNIGTIGGNVCNGVTSADSGSTLVAWDAVMEITGSDGVRQIPIQEFYLKPGVVDLKPGELLTAILIPEKSYKGYKGNYFKYSMRNAMDIATIGCSANVKLSEDKKTFEDMRLAFGVAGPVPMRAPSAEKALIGKAVTMENIEAAADAALEDVNPRDSWRASKVLRIQLIHELSKRAIRKSVILSGGVL